ncbi:hypothetical protein XAB3213_3340020 [Xanthomonas citri pv. bilvae]|nr:hypothetical protein XAB3213_3340020 [Xanthomonas citri pv. bilvae]
MHAASNENAKRFSGRRRSSRISYSVVGLRSVATRQPPRKQSNLKSKASERVVLNVGAARSRRRMPL